MPTLENVFVAHRDVDDFDAAERDLVPSEMRVGLPECVVRYPRRAKHNHAAGIGSGTICARRLNARTLYGAKHGCRRVSVEGLGAVETAVARISASQRHRSLLEIPEDRK